MPTRPVLTEADVHPAIREKLGGKHRGLGERHCDPQILERCAGP